MPKVSHPAESPEFMGRIKYYTEYTSDFKDSLCTPVSESAGIGLQGAVGWHSGLSSFQRRAERAIMAPPVPAVPMPIINQIVASNTTLYGPILYLNAYRLGPLPNDAVTEQNGPDRWHGFGPKHQTGTIIFG